MIKAAKRTNVASRAQSSKKKFKKFDLNVYCNDCGSVLNNHEKEANRCWSCRAPNLAVARP